MSDGDDEGDVCDRDDRSDGGDRDDGGGCGGEEVEMMMEVVVVVKMYK